MKTEAVVKKAGSAAAKFGSATLGLAAGSFVANRVPAFGPPIVQKILPGLAVMVAAFAIGAKFKSNENVEAGAIGMGLAGFANIAKQFLPATVTSYIPLAGVAGVEQNINPSLVLGNVSPEPMHYLESVAV